MHHYFHAYITDETKYLFEKSFQMCKDAVPCSFTQEMFLNLMLKHFLKMKMEPIEQALYIQIKKVFPRYKMDRTLKQHGKHPSK